MRFAVLAIAASSLAVAGCGKNDAADNAAVPGETVTAEDFATNDVTAIDAATGADANMAADVDINAYEPAENGSGDGAASNVSRPARPRAPAPASAATSNQVDGDEPVESPAPAQPPVESNAG